MIFARLINKIISNFTSNKIIVLMYHRVVSKVGDPWQLAVSPANFELQLAVLKKNFNIISLPELIKQIEQKKIVNNSICLTFDDAYSDNFVYAKPVLEKYHCPATFFVPTKYINEKKMFWWDDLEEVILRSSSLPLKLLLNINGNDFEFQLKKNQLDKNELEAQNYWTYKEYPPTERCKLYLEIYALFRQFSEKDVQFYLNEIKKWAGYQIKQIQGGAMNSLQLKELSNNPLFSLGIHTCTHLDLNFQPLLVQQQQIKECAEYLKFQYKNFVNAIAYPFGSYNDTTLETVKQQQISVGFTTNFGLINKHSNPYELGRFEVLNISGIDLLVQLRTLLL